MEIRKRVWVIMDQKRGIIGKGIPRNRYLYLVSDENESRILTYSSKGRAEAGFHGSWFYRARGVEEYFKRVYGIWDEWKDGEHIHHGLEEKDVIEAVECDLILEEIKPL